MGEGIRLVHDTHRSTDFVVPFLDDVHTAARFCHVCDRSYDHKHVHFVLDDQGAVLATAGMWDNLQAVGGAGFTLSNTVTNPPAQGMGMKDLRHERDRNPNDFQPVTFGRGRRKTT